LQAQAEAQAQALIAAALADDPDVLTFRYIDKLAPNVQVIYLPSGQGNRFLTFQLGNSPLRTWQTWDETTAASLVPSAVTPV
jgi:hypothetical protein